MHLLLCNTVRQLHLGCFECLVVILSLFVQGFHTLNHGVVPL